MQNQKTKDKLFGFTYYLIIVLIQLGVFVPITAYAPKKVKSDHKNPINGYFRIACIPNLVWMHVQDGYGVFINEYIVSNSGNYINLVEALSGYYWYIDNSSNKIRSAGLGNRDLVRCIGSLIQYGEITKGLPRTLDVHHKWWKWCNTQNTIIVVCGKRHQYFHNEMNSRRSHQHGCYVDNIQFAERLFADIGKMDLYYRKIWM